MAQRHSPGHYLMRKQEARQGMLAVVQGDGTESRQHTLVLIFKAATQGG